MNIKACFKEAKSHFHNTSKRIEVENISKETFDHKTFVLVEDANTGDELFNIQINSEHNCSFFRGLKVWKKFVVIGFDSYCYIFDVEKENISTYKLNSFFDGFFVTNENIFVCSTSYINCFNSNAEFLWRSNKLANESVKIEGVADGFIQGAGKWDEHGWVSFDLPLLNGGVEPKKQKKSSLFSRFINQLAG